MEKLKVRMRGARKVIFLLLVIALATRKFETHLAKLGKTIFSNRITNLMSRALNFRV